MIIKTLVLSLLLVESVGLVSADYNDSIRHFEQQDYRPALQQFSDAASRGDVDAKHMLGCLNEAGNGTTQDFVQAHKSYNLAAPHGHRHAGEAREALAERVTYSQIARVQRAARNWQQEEAAGSPSRPDIDSLSDRERVTVSQRELNRLDYDAGPTDVAMGSRTRTAIYHYQTDLGIAQNDRASTNLLQRLRQTETHEVTAPTISSGAALRDNFNDGDYRFNPGWTLLSGDFEDGRLHNIVWTRARNKRMQSAWTAAIR